MADKGGYIGRNPGDSQVTIARQQFTPTGVTTDFTFTSGYTVGYVDVYINGAKILVGRDYTATNGSVVGLTSAAQNGDIIEIVAYKAFNVSNVSESNGNFTVGGILTVDDNTTLSGQLEVTGVTTFASNVENIVTSGVITATTFSGNITGTSVTFTNGTFTGDVSIGGTLTYEDVTNIDSVGIVTARAGVNVSGGQLLVGSGVTIGYAGVATFSGTSDIHLKDNVKLNVGDSLDLNIYHDGSNSYIQDSGSGALIVTAADQCVFQKGDGSNRVLNLHTTNGTAALMHQGNQKLITSSSGVSVTGDTTADGLIVGSGITFGSAGGATFSGTADIHLHDNVQLKIGDSSDLALYHNSSGNSWMYNGSNGGDLYIGANAGEIYIQTGASANDTAIKIVSDGMVELRHDNNWKLQTTNDGIYVNGIGTATRSYVNSPSQREDDNIPLLVKGIVREDPVIGIQGKSSNGVTLLADAYVDGESQMTLGLHYSGSGLVLGQVGVSTDTNNAYVSIQDAYGHRPAAMVIDDGVIKFRNDTADGVRPVGTAVTMYDRMKIEHSGRVLIGDGSTYNASGDLHIVGDNNSNGPELYLQVNNNNTTDNIGALWYGNNGDKSLNKIAGHTKLATNTSYLTFHTSKAGTLGQRFELNNDGAVTTGIGTISSSLVVGTDANVTGSWSQTDWNLEVYDSAADCYTLFAGAAGATIELRDTVTNEAFVIAANGNCNLYSYNAGDDIAFHTKPGGGSVTQRLIIGAAGISTFSTTPHDDKGDLRSIPVNSQSGAYVLVAADAGKAVYISTGGVTINTSVFATGDAVTIINNSGSDQTITQGSGFTLYNTADASTGNKTLSGRGMATVWFSSANAGYISGNLS